jgi:hypothetical protein
VRAGESAIDAFCEDYACLAWGLLELFQADGDADWLAWALRVQETQHALFWDEAGTGWFSTTGADPSILLRMTEEHDGAEPAATSVSVHNAIVTARLVGGAHADRARQVLARAGARLTGGGRSVPWLLAGLAGWHAAPAQVVVVGEPTDEATRALRRAVARAYRPWLVEVPVAPGAAQARLAGLIPQVAAMRCREGRPTAYVCRDFTCLEPVTTVEALARQLQEVGA